MSRVRVLDAMCERWGRLPWAEIVAPARALVEGQTYSLVRSDIGPKREVIARDPSTAALLLAGQAAASSAYACRWCNGSSMPRPPTPQPWLHASTR